ncbi:response regulator transcription factor [Rugosimonospora africana]|uniref:DNA-binding response regulator n=1 Tax=Rugosimonospora africana TaxID=556532 RepID=A0A8J3R1H4_9ACTN|nr:response regulator transcription factor [Rugosimonospora africana]GIH19877.1 DNA-binding response regulator [Rugosimonospora africana]
MGELVNDGIRVLVVDDHPVFRDGLRQLLRGSGEFTVVAEAADGLEALAYVQRNPVHVVLMDLHMPRMDGVTATARLREVAPQTRVLVLSTYDTDADVLPAIESGATGYLLKDASRAELLAAVRAAAKGESMLSPSVARRVLGRLREPVERVLKPREVELLRLVAGGATNREAAVALFVSEATVKASLLRVYERLGVRDRASAVAEAYRRGMLS